MGTCITSIVFQTTAVMAQVPLPKVLKDIFIVGGVDCQIIGNKLSSKKQVLKVLFFYLRHSKLNLHDSALLVAKEVLLFWDKGGIPTQTLQKCTEKIEKLHSAWRLLQKGKGQKYNTDKEEEFKKEIELLFDVAKAPEFLTDLEPEKLTFLEGQRQPDRIGFINDFKSVHDEELTMDEVRLIRERRLEKQRERERSSIGKHFFVYFFTTKNEKFQFQDIEIEILGSFF